MTSHPLIAVSATAPDRPPLRWHRRLVDRTARAVAGHPRAVLLVAGIAVVAFGFAARTLTFEPARFGSASELAARQDDHRARWGPDDGLLVAVLTVPQPSDDAVALVESLTSDAVASVPGARAARSATSQPVVGATAAGPALGPAFGSRSPYSATLTDRAELARSSRLGAGTLVSADARTFAVVVELDDDLHTYDQIAGPASTYRSYVEQRVAASGVPAQVDFAGVAYTHVASVGQTQHDLARLLPLAALLMTIILWAALRSPVAVLATLATAAAAMVVTAGSIALMGHSINQVTPVYPVLLLAVVVSGATHLVHRYFAERRGGADAPGAAHRTVFQVGPPAFACAITTAAGFASLALADITALREFGTQAAIGVLAAFVLQLTVIPAVLVWRDADAPARRRTVTDAGWTRRYAAWVTRPEVARVVVALGVALCVVSVFVARTARFDYRAADALGPDDPVSIGNARISERLGGIIPFDVGLAAGPGAFRDLDNVRRLDELSTWLDRREGIRTLALPSLLREQTRALTGRDELPATQAELDTELAVLERLAADDLRTVVDADYAHARVRAIAPDRGAQHFGALGADSDRAAAVAFAGTGVQAGLTGEAVVAYDGMIRLTSQLVASTLAAMVIILLTVLTLFRSVRLALVAFLPNALPIVVGFAGYRLSSEILDPLPSVVFCIALGLAADDTIHLISRWREIDRSGPVDAPDRRRASLIRALGLTQRAMVSSTLVLAAGFAVLLVSDLELTRRIGGLGTYLLLVALVADLVFGVAGLALLARDLDRRRDLRTVVAARTAGATTSARWAPALNHALAPAATGAREPADTAAPVALPVPSRPSGPER